MDTDPTGRGRPQGGGNVLHVGDPSYATVWFRDVGTFGGNGEESIRVAHRVPQTDHWEASTVDKRRGVGDTRGGSSAGSGENAVGDDLYRETPGNRGTVGGVTANIQSVCRGEGVWWG